MQETRVCIRSCAVAQCLCNSTVPPHAGGFGYPEGVFSNASVDSVSTCRQPVLFSVHHPAVHHPASRTMMWKWLFCASCACEVPDDWPAMRPPTGIADNTIRSHPS